MSEETNQEQPVVDDGEQQSKPPAKTASPKKAFGGYAVNFAGRKETAEQIFGSVPIPPSEMTKKLWAYVKNNKLSNKK